MNRTPRKGAAILDKASPAFILMSRVVIGMIALLLAVIPWSERYSLLDNFPHSQDTELNLLALFVVLGLILLIVRSSARQLRSMLVVRYWPLTMIRRMVSAMPETGPAVPPRCGSPPPLSPSPGDTYNLPLQI